MKIVSIVFCLIAYLCACAWADNSVDVIYDLYQNGKITEAKALLQKLPESPTRDGNRLFLAALLEKKGMVAKEKLKAALRSDLDGKYTEEAYYRLIQLAEAQGDTSQAVHAATTFLETWEMSTHRANLLALLAAYSKDRKRYLNLLIDEEPGRYFGQFARIQKAEAAFQRKHFKTATTLCRRMNNAADDNLTPSSLILLAKIGLENNNDERALFNYNILHEQYRYAIGEEELLEALKKVSEKSSGQESTEVFEGITYSVKVGVFAEKGNAKKMAKRVEGYGFKAYIRKRKISEKTYYVVQAGKFKTMKAARAAKGKLEAGEGDIFKVMVHDEK